MADKTSADALIGTITGDDYGRYGMVASFRLVWAAWALWVARDQLNDYLREVSA